MVKHPLITPLPVGGRFRQFAICATLLISAQILSTSNASVFRRTANIQEDNKFRNESLSISSSQGANKPKNSNNLAYYRYNHPSNAEKNVTNFLSLENKTSSEDEFVSSPQMDENSDYSLFYVPVRTSSAKIYGLRVEEVSKGVSYDGSISVIVADRDATIRLFGDGFTGNTIIKFVTDVRPRGSECDSLSSTPPFALQKITQHSVLAIIRLPPPTGKGQKFYLCTKENGSDTSWVHEGTDQSLTMKSYELFLPLWSRILMIPLLLALSGLFAGLNLGLMALDITELKIIEKVGTENEKSFVKTVAPLRHAGNYLLCTILLGNVLFNSTLTILLDDITTGLIAVISSTIAIVIFAEIIPQAICSRYGLAVGAYTAWITKFAMALAFPLAYPVSCILDKLLGEEIGNVYNRERLRELIKVTERHHDLNPDEVKVIEGVLKLCQVTCVQVMTRLEDVFMLSLQAMLNYETINDIIKSGYSRIPIYDSYRGNVVSILYTKDLAFVDPEDGMPLKSLCEFHQHQCNFVDETEPLDVMFREFRDGNKGHMAFVRRMHYGDNADPFYEVVGVLTLEDVIEELIQAEISDETDVRDGYINRVPSRATLNEMSVCSESRGSDIEGIGSGSGGGGDDDCPSFTISPTRSGEKP